jgi:hypothetical protein
MLEFIYAIFQFLVRQMRERGLSNSSEKRDSLLTPFSATKMDFLGAHEFHEMRETL